MKEKILLINKPRGMTSHDVVDLVRRKTGEKRVGHTGTLDPMAEGLLIVLVGKEATKRQQEFMKIEKEYVAMIRLGATSTTNDAEGEITMTKVQALMTNKIPISEFKIQSVLRKFIGNIEQVPPAYSAVKIKGERAYKLARKGMRPPLKPRRVTIATIETLSYRYPLLKIRVVCSSGTYIRALARDIGEKLGLGAYLETLVRTRIGPYRLESTRGLED